MDGRYENVVDEFLRDELNYIVVKSWDAADAGVQMLHGDVAGRATFLVHPNDAQAAFPFVEGMQSASNPPSRRHCAAHRLRARIERVWAFA